MGQRLNVEIWSKGKVLANAYYHWSAYTSSAAEIVGKVIAATKIFSVDRNELLYAIRLLEATGAGLTEDECNHVREQAAFKDCDFRECEGRDSGLISVTEEGIRETRHWEDGTVRIYVDEKRISFRVFWTESCYEWEKEQREYNGVENADHRKLLEVDFNFDDIKFDDWGVAFAFLKRIEEPFKTNLNYFEVITPIY